MQHATDITHGFSIEPWVMALEIPALFAGLDYRIVCINAAALDLLDVSGEKVFVGKGLRPLLNSEKAVDLFADLVAMQRDDGSVRRSIAHFGLDPSHRFSVTALRGQKNAILGFLFQKADAAEALTRSTVASAQLPVPPELGSSDFTLAESEWRWKMAVHSADQGIWDHDFENDRHYVSRTWRDLRGLSVADAFPGSTEDWLRTIHPADIDHIQEELRKLDAGETDSINYKFRQRHAAGHWVWFFSKGRVVRRTASGEVARIIGTDTDISEIKKVEMESQRMARRLEAALQASGMARWEYDIGARYVFWDDQMLRLAGIEDGQNIRSANDLKTIVHPEDRARVLDTTRAALAEERDFNSDHRILRPDGTVRYVRSRGTCVREEGSNTRFYGVVMDVTRDHERTLALEEARARLEHDSRHDALTGLANRRYLDANYLDLAQTKQSQKNRVAVMHFDVDHFKQINDTLGHDAGDALLKHVADVLVRNLPDGTVVSRVGGDEFVALLATAPAQPVLRSLAELIIEEMSEPFFYDSQLCNVGTSIGVAISAPDEPLENSLFIHADLALYDAKKAGRGRVRFFDDAMKQEARRRKNSFDALLDGFEQGEITCHYQPQFDARTLELAGVEALVRWESKKHGLMMPDEFLGTAADMGLMADFDELVLKKALEDLETWDAAGFDVPRISVNVSSHRLNDPTLSQRLSRVNLPRGRLSFELLESAFLDSRNEVIDRNLALLDEIGIEIEIDDFGSGHASIVSLLQIAPKRLKVDRVLVGPVINSKRQRDLVGRILEIGKMLDVTVIAEGVETSEHVEVMRNLDCDILQGYGLARPMDRAAIVDLLARMRENGGHLELG